MGSSRSSGRAERTAPSAGASAEVLDAVRASLHRFDPTAPIVVGFSGGVDSTVLLDAVARCRAGESVVAWHVHHGLQPQADDWSLHCEREAQRLGVRFGVTRLDPPSRAGINVEAWARDARYAALWSAVSRAGAVALLVAHNADDQLETMLMRLARGSAPEALAGMRAGERRAGGWLLRPLLSIRRERIVACARERRLAWIDDPMNEDESLLRVALRTRVIPELERIAPSLHENALRSAQWLREAGEALRELAERDLRESGVAPGARSIDRRALAALPPARRARAVRAWFDSLGAPMPGRARLAQWIAQMLLGESAHARIVHGRWRFLRYRDRIEVRETADDADAAPPAFTFRWRGEREIAVPGWGGSLRFVPTARTDAPAAGWLAAQPLEVRAARGAQRLRPRAQGPSRTLKNLLQERGISPHLRRRLPALHAGEALLYVAGIGMDRGAHGDVGDAARIEIDWRFDDPDDPRARLRGPAPPV